MSYMNKKSPCYGCLYYRGRSESGMVCNYFLDTGNRRPCAAGEGCTVKFVPPKEEK